MITVITSPDRRAGTTTIATNLAVRRQKDAEVVLFDLTKNRAATKWSDIRRYDDKLDHICILRTGLANTLTSLNKKEHSVIVDIDIDSAILTEVMQVADYVLVSIKDFNIFSISYISNLIKKANPSLQYSFIFSNFRTVTDEHDDCVNYINGIYNYLGVFMSCGVQHRGAYMYAASGLGVTELKKIHDPGRAAAKEIEDLYSSLCW